MKKRNLNYTSYLAPKYWLIWLLLGLGQFIAWLPLRVQQMIGVVLGRLAYLLMKRRRKIAERNITLCFPLKSPLEQQQLVKNSFRSNGMGVIEALRSWYRDPETLRSTTDYRGHEHIKQALAKGKGVILLGGHYSTLDLAGGLTTLFFEADVLQRDHSNPLFNAFVTRSRLRLYQTVLDKFDLRGMLRCLKRNRIVWYATDQDYGHNNTVFAPFFGQECATLVSTMKIAKSSGAAVLPFSHFRNEQTGRYEIVVHEALENFPSDGFSGDRFSDSDLSDSGCPKSSLELDAERLNMILVREIRKAPEQYLWMHRRFKTQRKQGTGTIYD